MSTRWYMTSTTLESETLNPLLPCVAGVFESVNEATFPDIKRQIELDIGHKVPDSKILSALDNGVKLGVLMIKREFKVCREFTTKELKKLKNIEDNLVGLNSLKGGETKVKKERGKALLEFVRSQRERRRKKSSRKVKCKSKPVLSAFPNGRLYKFLCQRCKKSLEKKGEMRSSGTGIAPADEEFKGDAGSPIYLGSSCASSFSEVSAGGGQSQKEMNDTTPIKSKLKVEKNPMETEPPYYDIFT